MLFGLFFVLETLEFLGEGDYVRLEKCILNTDLQIGLIPFFSDGKG